MKVKIGPFIAIIVALAILLGVILGVHDLLNEKFVIQENGITKDKLELGETVVNPEWIAECNIAFDLTYSLPNDYGRSWNFSVFKDEYLFFGTITITDNEKDYTTLIEYVNESVVDYWTVDGELIDLNYCINKEPRYVWQNYSVYSKDLNKTWLNNNAVCTSFCEGKLNQEDCWKSYVQAYEEFGESPKKANCNRWFLNKYIIWIT